MQVLVFGLPFDYRVGKYLMKLSHTTGPWYPAETWSARHEICLYKLLERFAVSNAASWTGIDCVYQLWCDCTGQCDTGL